MRSAMLAMLLMSLSAGFAFAQGAAASNPDFACARCHRNIFDSYQKTIMAKASGPATEGLVTGDFFHQPSGVQYRVFRRDSRAWMSYRRDGEPKLGGQRELLYYIGSGRKGRSYVFGLQGFLFETPINWYSQEARWNMAPAYIEAREIPLNLPLVTDCLNCHASGVQPPIAGTGNRYAGPPFLHGGITCERCHGDGSAHLDGKGPIVNPAKLSPQRRDAVCMECHFEGTVAVAQPAKQVYEFQPGENLSDYMHYFLLTGNQQQKPEALSQTEALSLSMCKRKSGDKMSCISCHDPHFEPSAGERAAYYRGKCLVCHGEKFGAKHHPENRDCTACHMPSLPSKEVAHTQATDHRILRRPREAMAQLQDAKLQSANRMPRLIAFPAREKDTDRDLGLAWQNLAQRGIEGAAANAKQHLEKALKEDPNDAVVLSALAYLEQKNGRSEEAKELYQKALQIDPLLNDAATNLGVLEAKAGDLKRAVELWQQAFEREPYRSEIGTNLALAFCDSGQIEDARKYLDRVLEFNPDFSPARALGKNMNGGRTRCTP